MERGKPSDLARVAVGLLAAVFMIGANGVAFTRIVDDASLRTPIDPAAYAFSIWGVIFLLGILFAVYQALPGNHAREVFRRVGWWVGAAYIGVGLWAVVVFADRLNLAQALLTMMAVCAGVAYLRLAQSHDLRSVDRWLIALPIATLFGWLTAANAVSLCSRAFDLGLFSMNRTGELIAAGLLILAGCAAAWFIRAGQRGPVQLWGVYAAAIVWAVVAVVVQNVGFSTVGVVAAVLAAIPPVIAVLTYRSQTTPPGDVLPDLATT